MFITWLAEGMATDAMTHEFDSEGLRRQAGHVLQIFTISIQGGTSATFWFIFPHYAEKQTQFGVIRADVTPRPNYLALAAAADRLLADAKPVGRSLLSLRLLPLLPAKPRAVRDMPALLDAKRWQASSPKEAKLTVAAVPEGILVELDRGPSDPKWFNLSLNLDPQERPTAAENALLLPVMILEGEASLSVRLDEDNGGNYAVSYGMGQRARSDDGAISFGAAVTPRTLSEPQGNLDPRRLRSIQIGSGEVKTPRLRLVIKKLRGPSQAAVKQTKAAKNAT